jgi:hypothetical protein
MITALIGIQTACVTLATGYVISHFRPTKAKLKVHSTDRNGFKHYKTY